MDMKTIERIESLFMMSEIAATTLQEKMGLSSSALTEWKKGKALPSRDALIKTAEYFHVSLDWLVFGDKCDAYIRRPLDNEEWMKNHCENRGMAAVIRMHNPNVEKPQDVEKLYHSLSEEDQKRVISYMDALAGNTVPTDQKNSKALVAARGMSIPMVIHI